MGNGEAEEAAARRDMDMVQRSEEREREGGRSEAESSLQKRGGWVF